MESPSQRDVSATRDALVTQIRDQRLATMAERADANIPKAAADVMADLAPAVATMLAAVKALPEVVEAHRFKCSLEPTSEEGKVVSAKYDQLVTDITNYMSKCKARAASDVPSLGPERSHGRILEVAQAIHINLMRSYAKPDTYGLTFIGMVSDQHKIVEWVGVRDLDDSDEHWPWMNRRGTELDRRVHYADLTSPMRRGPDAPPMEPREYAAPLSKCDVARGDHGITLRHPTHADLFLVWKAEGCPSSNPKGYWVANPDDYYYYRATKMVVERHGDQEFLHCQATPRSSSAQPICQFYVSLTECVRMWAGPPCFDSTHGNPVDQIEPVDAIEHWDDRHHNQWIEFNWIKRSTDPLHRQVVKIYAIG